jgi:hypothetical protein
MNLREQIEKEITEKVMTKLASEKIKLGVIDDNLKMYEKALSEFDNASKIRQEAARKYIDASDLFKKVIKEAITTTDMADSLGIPIPKLETAIKESQRLEKIANSYVKELR